MRNAISQSCISCRSLVKSNKNKISFDKSGNKTYYGANKPPIPNNNINVS